MSDNKKYYYLKLKDNFYDSDEIKILSSMDNGYKYTTLLLKIYLKSLKNDGKLMLNEYIPYNTQMIATITDMDIDTVKVAMDIFENLKLIEKLEDGTIYLLNIQNYIGKSSTEADRIRDYRVSISDKKQKLLSKSTDVVQMYDERTPELEKELDLELEKELDPKPIDKTNSKSLYDDIIKAYNNTCTSLPKLRQLSKNRKAKLNSRLLELKTLEDFQELFTKVQESSFLTGENKNNWKCTFDWLIENDNNYVKVLEGQYSNKEKTSQVVNPYSNISS